MGNVLRRLGALFTLGGGGKLARATPAGERRMKRRWITAVAGLLALAALGALSVGVYARFYRPAPAAPETPELIDTGDRLPTQAEFDALAETDPLKMYEACLKRYQREVKNGFTATLIKKERVKGEPKPPKEPQEEVISLSVRGDVPDESGKHTIEVAMEWKEGARAPLFAKIIASLYSEKPAAEGGTGGKVQVRQDSRLLRHPPTINPTDDLAKGVARYCIRDAGVYRGMLRTYDAWKQRKEAGTLKTAYLGKKPIPEVDGRVCHVVERTCPSPEADPFELGASPVTDPKVIEREGFVRVRVMIDAETWQQVGSELYRADGELLASYYFRNPNTSPTFAPDTFDHATFKKK